MKNGWFKPQLSLDGVGMLLAIVAVIWFLADMKFQLVSNGHILRHVATTQVDVIKCLQQIKDQIQRDHPTNSLDITVPLPNPLFDLDINANVRDTAFAPDGHPVHN